MQFCPILTGQTRGLKKRTIEKSTQGTWLKVWRSLIRGIHYKWKIIYKGSIFKQRRQGLLLDHTLGLRCTEILLLWSSKCWCHHTRLDLLSCFSISWGKCKLSGASGFAHAKYRSGLWFQLDCFYGEQCNVVSTPQADFSSS